MMKQSRIPRLSVALTGSLCTSCAFSGSQNGIFFDAGLSSDVLAPVALLSRRLGTSHEAREALQPGGCDPTHTVDGCEVRAWKPGLKPEGLLVFTLGKHPKPGFLRRCELDFVHPQ